MSNNKAREINNPIIEELINETSPEELAKIDADMTNNKQQSSVEWLIEHYTFADLTADSWQMIQQQAKEMEIAGKEMSYSDGYAEGYKRAYELMEWCMKNYIKGRVQHHIGDINKMVQQ
jgi:flagellar biosynthesis/type III secretory pathway protein FliH